MIVLGTVGFAAVGTLFAAMTAHVRARELLFPVLLLPVLVPVLLGTVKATEAVLLGEPLGAVAHWLKLLAAADVVYLVVGHPHLRRRAGGLRRRDAGRSAGSTAVGARRRAWSWRSGWRRAR